MNKFHLIFTVTLILFIGISALLKQKTILLPNMLESRTNSKPMIKTSANQNNDFIYPNSTITSTSGNKTYLTSNDNSADITYWYRNKITSLGYKNNSHITNTANGNIINKLSATNDKQAVIIDITKGQNDTKTSIIITLATH